MTSPQRLADILPVEMAELRCRLLFMLLDVQPAIPVGDTLERDEFSVNRFGIPKSVEF
jgi:hypothetical protein